jgi:DNA repair photolyase
MPIIYEPQGKAGEYAPLAANLYKGCGHRCEYCYAPKMLRKTGMTWEQFCKPQPRPRVLEQLEKDCRKFAGDSREVLMCFTSDPYQPLEYETQLTRHAVGLMAEHDLKPTILTKAGPWAIERDCNALAQAGATWAATLTLDDAEASAEWEPGAAPPEDRIEALQLAKACGLQTWVSFEPVLDPDVVLELIDATHEFVDLYKVGKLNYHPLAKEINWADFKDSVETKLQSLGKPYYLKRDLVDAWHKARKAA